MLSRFNPRPSRGTGATDAQENDKQRQFVSILARPEGRALQSAYNVMTFNGEKRTLRELSIFVQQKVRTIKQRS